MPDFNLQIHKGQAAILGCKARFILVFAGTGSGKSTTTPIWLMERIAEDWEYKPKQPGDELWYLVVAPSTDLLTSVQTAMAPYLSEVGDPAFGEAHDGWEASKKQWHLANGAIVRFRSADQPRLLQAIHARAIVVDEAGLIDDATWNVIKQRSDFHAARILAVSTFYAPTPDWVIEAVRAEQEQTDPETKVISFPSIWNPAYPMKTWNEAKARLSAWEFALYYEAKLTRPTGAVYPNFSNETHVVDPFVLGTPLYRGGEPLLDDKGQQRYEMWPVFSGMDHGTTVPTAVLSAALSPNDELYIFAEYYQTNATARNIADHLKNLPVPTQRVYCDPSAASVRLELRSLDLPVIGADNEVGDGISETFSRIGTNRLFVLRGGAPSLLHEMERYRRTKEGHIVKQDDHAMDALRYLVMGVRRNVQKIVALWA